MRQAVIAGLAALATAVGGGGIAGADMFGAWDQDRDLYVSEREWDEGFTKEGMFDAWDLDDDGVLSREEFNSQVFRGYDRSNDRRLSEREFNGFISDATEEGVFDQ